MKWNKSKQTYGTFKDIKWFQQASYQKIYKNKDIYFYRLTLWEIKLSNTNSLRNEGTK